MQVAIMSDSHDNIWNMRKAVEIVKNSNAELLIHCGDFIAPFMLKELDDAGIPVHGVFGNNDGDQFTLTRMAAVTLNNITLHGLSGQVDAAGFSIGFTHYAELGAGLVSAGQCQLVCFGHTHVHDIKKDAGVTLLNPGEVMGKEGAPGFCFVDTETAAIKRVEL